MKLQALSLALLGGTAITPLVRGTSMGGKSKLNWNFAAAKAQGTMAIAVGAVRLVSFECIKAFTYWDC